MSIQFNGSDANPGIIQFIEDELGFNRGEISGDTNLMARFTAYVNLSLDEVKDIQSEFGEFSNPDDTNHTTVPIFAADAVANQQDYSFDEDTAGNKITHISKVMFEGATLTPVDQQSKGQDMDYFQDGSTGTPKVVDITGNTWQVWPTPAEDVAGAFTIFGEREGSYFGVADTDKVPGYSPSHHYFSVISPCERYARMNTEANHADFLREKLRMEDALRKSIARKVNLRPRRMVPNISDTR